MEAVAVKHWHYPAALASTLVSLALGNLLGVILASLWGWDNIEIGRPGGVAVGFIQGLVGALIAYVAASKFFHAPRLANFWLRIIIAIVALVSGLSLVALTLWGQAGDIFSWKGMAALAALIGTEVGRRTGLAEFG